MIPTSTKFRTTHIQNWDTIHLSQVIQNQLDVGMESSAKPSGLGLNLKKRGANSDKEDSITKEIPVQTNKGGQNQKAGSSSGGVPQAEFVGTEMDAMKDMVPIIMKTSLAEFKEHSDNIIYAGKDLNWIEFVQMFIKDQDPNDYTVKGDGGRSLLLDSKIGDYINTFKRPAKCYLVWMERELDDGPIPETLANAKNPKGNLKRKSPSPRRTSPKRKRMKVNLPQRKIKFPNPQKISPKVQVTEPTLRRSRARLSRRFESPDVPIAVNGISFEIGTEQEPEPQITPILQKDSNQDSSGTESRKSPQHEQLLDHPPNLKTELLNFMNAKVSNKDMLRIRQELMKLKEKEDYFKFTALTPLTAGLLEQMLCRDLPAPKPTSNAIA